MKTSEYIENVYYRNDKLYKKAKNVNNEIKNNEILEYIGATTEYIIQTLEMIEDIFLEKLVNDIQSTYYGFLILAFIIGIFIDCIVFRLLIKNYVKTRFVEIDELLEIIFFVPQNIIKISPKFKRFIESGESDL